jgi:hypothetical protein
MSFINNYLKNLFSNEFIINIGFKLVYLYSYCEILFKKYCPPLLTNNTNTENQLFMYKNGKLTEKDDYDLLIYNRKSNKNNRFNIKCIINDTERIDNYYTLTNYKFISFTINYLGDEYEVQLYSPNYTYYVVNNCINKEFIKYYLVNYCNLDISNTDFSYTTIILDENMNVVSFTENDKLILFYDTYTIN